MQSIDAIKSSLNYIEQNLKTDINPEELAKMAGYSLWHYYRLFADITGLPVAAYICKRRLDRALSEISCGHKGINVVLEYGFDTYAGFYKAFCKMYGCSPKKFLSLYGKYQSKNLGGYMITENELREVLKNWDISQILKLNNVCTMDGKKVLGSVWILGDKYVLKTGERDFILKNLRVQKALAKQGFSSIVSVCTKSGAEYLGGERVYTLMQKVAGAPLQKSDRFGDNRYDFGFKYGQSIAKLHRALSDVEKDVMPNEVKIYEQITNWAMPDVKKQNEQWKIGLSDSFFEDYVKTFGAFESQLPKQLIHRDPNPSNILFNGGEVGGFIDFDLSESNIRLWDPCYCATGILSEGTGVDNIQEKWFAVLNGILHGYNSVNPLTDAEKQSIFYVICSIQMICAAYFESVNEYKELAKISREMLFFIAENKTRIMAIF